MEKGRDPRQDLTTEYNRMPSPAPPTATYEVPVERPGAYENVQPSGVGGGDGQSVPKLNISDLA